MLVSGGTIKIKAFPKTLKNVSKGKNSKTHTFVLC